MDYLVINGAVVISTHKEIIEAIKAAQRFIDRLTDHTNVVRVAVCLGPDVTWTPDYDH